MTTRNALRAGVVGSLTGLALLAASSALAVTPDDGSEPGESLAPLMTLLWFVVVPIGLFLLIALLVSLPSIMGGPRYRPGLGWRATPEWYGGPEGDEEGGTAEAPATRRATISGGDASADQQGDAPTGPQSGARTDTAADSSDGGASARW